MSKLLKSVRKQWFLYIVELILFIQAVVFLGYRENSYIAVHDNLDLFIAHFRVMKLNDAFFAHGVELPIVGGLDRDVFGSEFSLYNIMYYLFPGIVAYFIGYALKVLIGMFSFVLLIKDIYKEDYRRYRPLAWITGTAFGLIPVFPAYGIAFTSVPLLIYILRRIYYAKDIKSLLKWYAALFAYPFLSYFSYHGFFILGYMACAVLILWIKDRRFPGRILLSVIVLSLGYMIFEYRLFGAMLFSDTVTIRNSMVISSFSIGEVLRLAGEGFLNSQFHCQDSHMYVILPISIIAIIYFNIRHIIDKDGKDILKDPINLIFLWIVFNCLVYGFYNYEPLRNIVETLVPKLKGFQFDRTIFFNPFLWYALLFMIAARLYDTSLKAWVLIGNLAVTFALLVVMFEPQVYNDFYYTCYNQAYKLIKHKETSTVDYREFYSENLFNRIKADIDYEGEWSVAYGMHPAVLEYNGISTLDGYIGMYTEEYKKKWRAVIAPALERSPEFKTYFDEWGPRAYVFSGNGENTYAPLRDLELEDRNLYIDPGALKELGGRYVFSRIELENADELGLKLTGTYTADDSPYEIWLYELQ